MATSIVPGSGTAWGYTGVVRLQIYTHTHSHALTHAHTFTHTHTHSHTLSQLDKDIRNIETI